MKTFELLPEHLTLLRKMHWDGNEGVEAGSPGADAKRPFGNSYVPGDIAEILKWDINEKEGLTEEQVDKAWVIFHGLHNALEIVLQEADPILGTYIKHHGPNYKWKTQQQTPE
jgi:hypothetical protein